MYSATNKSIYKKIIMALMLNLLLSSFVFSQEWTLKKGWGLLGANSDIINFSNIDLGCVEKLYIYDKTSTPHKWIVYPDNSSTTIRKGKGFWINMKKDCTITTDLVENPDLIRNVKTETILVNGIERKYKIYIPENLSPDASVMFYFHGARTTPGDIRFAGIHNPILKLANENNIIAIYPLSSFSVVGGEFNWTHSLAKEEEYFDKLLQYLIDTYPKINAKKVYVTGHSSGASFALNLAGTRANKIAAAGITSGRVSLNSENDGFTNDNISTPLIAFHGINDTITQGMENSIDLWHTLENKGTLNFYFYIILGVNVS